MPSATRTITIDRPVEQVYAFFTDHTNDRTWRPAVIDIAPVRAAPAGTRIHQVVKGPFGRGIGADLEVTADDAPTTYAFRVVAGPVRPRGEFRFTPAASGTAVQFSLDAELTGLRKLLMSGMVQASMDSEMAGLDAAKGAIEST